MFSWNNLTSPLQRGGASQKMQREGQRNGGQGVSMARWRYQPGSVFLRGTKPRRWIGKWREHVREAQW